MLLGFDQLILTVADIEAAVSGFRRLGFAVVERADVGKRATESRFACFEDGGYVMLQHFRDPEAARRHRLAPVLDKGDGWADYAVWTDDLEGEGERLRKSSLSGVGPHLVSQSLADGRSWKVSLLLLGRGGGGSAVLPFLAQDRAERGLRVPVPPSRPFNPNGASGISGVTLVTDRADAVSDRLAALYGPSRPAGARYPGARAALRFEFAGRWVDLVEPGPADADMRAHLERRGEGLYEVALALGSPGRAPRLLPLDMACQARLTLG